MSDHVGVIRDADGMRKALRRKSSALSWMQARRHCEIWRELHCSSPPSAFARRESRGGHMRSDYPVPDPTLARIVPALRLAKHVG